jgi:hypothetical protein
MRARDSQSANPPVAGAHAQPSRFGQAARLPEVPGRRPGDRGRFVPARGDPWPLEAEQGRQRRYQLRRARHQVLDSFAVTRAQAGGSSAPARAATRCRHHPGRKQSGRRISLRSCSLRVPNSSDRTNRTGPNGTRQACARAEDAAKRALIIRQTEVRILPGPWLGRARCCRSGMCPCSQACSLDSWDATDGAPFGSRRGGLVRMVRTVARCGGPHQS